VDADGRLKDQIDASFTAQNQAAELLEYLNNLVIRERLEFKMQMKKIIQESQ
jgi:hypothetical protein